MNSDHKPKAIASPTKFTGFRGHMAIYIHLYLPRNMVAQADKTATSKNTTNEKEKKTQ